MSKYVWRQQKAILRFVSKGRLSVKNWKLKLGLFITSNKFSSDSNQCINVISCLICLIRSIWLKNVRRMKCKCLESIQFMDVVYYILCKVVTKVWRPCQFILSWMFDNTKQGRRNRWAGVPLPFRFLEKYKQFCSIQRSCITKG